MSSLPSAESAKAMLAVGQTVLQTQPFSRFLGARLSAFDGKDVDLTIPLRPEFLQQHGFAHGGLLAYAADNALTFAGGIALGAAVLTSEFKINYLRPAKGDAIVARASVTHAGKRQAVCRADILAQTGTELTLVAIAQGTIVRIESTASREAATSGDDSVSG